MAPWQDAGMRTTISPVISVRPDNLKTHTPGKQPAVFFDRDGVINTTDGFINRVEDVDRQLMDEAVQALARLSREFDGKIIMATNQGGVGYGKMTTEVAEAILDRFNEKIEEAGGRVDAICYCPNRKDFQPPEGEITGRKPGPGLLIAGAQMFGEQVDLADSYMIGDMTTDIAAGEAAGTTTILVETGFAGKDGKVDVQPDHTSKDLAAAVDWILSRN